MPKLFQYPAVLPKDDKRSLLFQGMARGTAGCASGNRGAVEKPGKFCVQNV